MQKKYRQILTYIITILLCLSALWNTAVAQLYTHDIKFEGNRFFSDGVLRETIELSEKSLVPKLLFWTDAPIFDETILQDDVRRLINFYISEGFIHAKVNAEQSSTGTEISVVFHVQENGPVRVAELLFTVINNDTVSGIISGYDIPVTNLELGYGARFSDMQFISDKQKITDYYANHGYPFAQVESDISLVNDSLKINHKINRGPLCTFGNIGFSPVNIPTRVLNKQLTFAEGEMFSQKELRETQQRLYNLGVFQIVSVNALLDSTLINTIPIQLQLREAPKFNSQIGFGYGKEDRFRVSLKLARIGFLGSVRKLTLNVRHSYLEPYNTNLVWLHPAFLFPGTSLSIEPFLRKEREPGYEIRRYGMGLNFKNKLSRYSNAFVRYAFEKDKLYLNSIPITHLKDQTLRSIYNKSSVTLGFIRDSSRPLLVPESGSYHTLTYTFSGLNFNSRYHYQRLLFETRRYFRVYGSVILAVKSKWGAVSSWKSGETIPIEERFFAGGYTSIRGWARSRLGPKDTDGKPVGGVSLMENSIELRSPFIPPVSAVLFLDVGNVWATNLSYPPRDWQYSPGIGFWMQTPIGPLRLDLASPLPFKLTNTQIYVNIGHAF